MKTKGLPKIMVSVLLAAVLVITLSLGIGCSTGKKDVKIGISQLVTHPALDAVREGIIEGLADEGYVEGENLEIDYQKQ